MLTQFHVATRGHSASVWCSNRMAGEFLDAVHASGSGREGVCMKLHAAFAFALFGSLSATSSAQVISGRLFEAGSSRPVDAAVVSLLATGRSVLSVESDSAGYFRVPVSRPGWYGLRVERLGYATASTDSLEVRAHENVEIVIRLGVTALPLEPLIVVERRTSVGFRTEFQRRFEAGRRSGQGWFVTRETLDSAGPVPVTSVLGRQPLLTVQSGADGRAWPVSLSHGGCAPTLYLNGARLTFAAGESLDDFLSTDNLEGIEIYRNRMETPPEYVGIGQCGAIVFWTRGGDPARRQGLWRLLAAGGAVLGMVVLFVVS